MAYTNINFKTKKELKEAVAAGKAVSVYNPGMGGPIDPNAKGVAIEMPHYPQPHKSYAQVDLKDGLVVKVK